MAAEVQSIFEGNGGEFLIPFADFQKKIANLRAFIFDWDGVFNNGVKNRGEGSPFSEIDSMGLNMLRFSYYLKYGRIPAIYIVTGENNLSAMHLSNREHFKAVYLKAKVKTEALEDIVSANEFEKDQVAFMFDDILDMGLAAETGTRFYVSRNANPLLNKFVDKRNLADYRTAGSGSNNPVREVCELCIGVNGNYNDVVELRVSNDSRYQQYLKLRDQISTSFYRIDRGNILEFEYP